MREEERPIVLVVCSDPDRLVRVRALVRQTGTLTAPGRSIPTAIHLLTQVVMDGCVLCEPATVEQARELCDALEGVRPGALRLALRECQGQPLDGWQPCSEEDVLALVSAAFTRL